MKNKLFFTMVVFLLSACAVVVTREEFLQKAVIEQMVAQKSLEATYKAVLDEARLIYGRDSGAIIVDGQLYPDLGSAEIDVVAKMGDNSLHYARYEFTKSGEETTAIVAYNRPRMDDYSTELLAWVRGFAATP